MTDNLPMVRRRVDGSEEIMSLALDALQAGLDARSRTDAMLDCRAVLSEYDDITVRRICFAMALLARLGDRQALRGALWRERLRQGLRQRRRAD